MIISLRCFYAIWDFKRAFLDGGATRKPCGIRSGWISPTAALRRRQSGFPLKPKPACRHRRDMIAFKSTLQSASRLRRPIKANGLCLNSLGDFLHNPLPFPILFCSHDFRGYKTGRFGRRRFAGVCDPIRHSHARQATSAHSVTALESRCTALQVHNLLRTQAGIPQREYVCAQEQVSTETGSG